MLGPINQKRDGPLDEGPGFAANLVLVSAAPVFVVIRITLVRMIIAIALRVVHIISFLLLWLVRRTRSAAKDFSYKSMECRIRGPASSAD